MSSHYDRAVFLYRQSRWELAGAELEECLAEHPGYAPAHALLALTLAERERWGEALRASDTALRCGADQPFPHYARAMLLERMRRYPEAAVSAYEALRLDSRAPANWYLLGHLYLRQGRVDDALSCAAEGLKADPADVDCANLRAAALVARGESHAAANAAGYALAHDPESAESHAWQGWARVERGDPPGALESFREALRLDPGLELARRGLVEATRARNPLYRGFTRFSRWVAGNLQSFSTWAWVFLALATGLLLPGLLLFFGFLFIWANALVEALSTLPLRLSPADRQALSRDEVLEPDLAVGLLAAAAASAGAGVALESPALGLLTAVLLLLVVPLAGVFRCTPGRPRRRMVAFGAGCALVGGAGAALESPVLVGLCMLLVIPTFWLAERLERAPLR